MSSDLDTYFGGKWMGVKKFFWDPKIGIAPLFFNTEGVPLVFWAKSVHQNFPITESLDTLDLVKIGKFEKTAEVYMAVRKT